MPASVKNFAKSRMFKVWIGLGLGLHSGENDSQKRQSQIWDQIICQTKAAKKFLWNWLVILMSCNSLTNFEYEEAFAKPELLKFGKKKSLP